MEQFWIASISGFVVGVLTILYNYYQYKKQIEHSNLSSISNRKIKVIEGIFSSRFALVESSSNFEAFKVFNESMGLIPLYFSHNKNVMDIYRSMSVIPTDELYYKLVIAMMDDIPLSTDKIDQDLFRSVLAVSKK